MTNKEFFDHWINFTSFSIEIEIAKLRLFRALINNFGDVHFQNIFNWEGKRSTDYYDDAGYCQLCADAVHFYLPDFDPDCSSVIHGIYEFLSDVILFVGEQRKDWAIKIKQEEIKKLQNQIEKLQEELIEDKK